MGRSLNLSPFVVIASLAFWGMIWGVIGAFLSVPMTTAFAIVCSHVPVAALDRDAAAGRQPRRAHERG